MFAIFKDNASTVLITMSQSIAFHSNVVVVAVVVVGGGDVVVLLLVSAVVVVVVVVVVDGDSVSIVSL